MSRESCLEEFKNSIELLLPAYLVIFDIADTKRRNNYLGHDEVDKDIIAFNNLLNNCVSLEKCKRIAGDIWVACFTEQQLNDLPDLIVNYAQEVPIVLTVWRCEAINPNGTSIFIEEERTVSIRRAVRCGYLWVKNINELIIKVNESLDRVRCLTVNTLTSLESEVAVHLPRWQCIPPESLSVTKYCPYCNSTNLRWLRVDEDVTEYICTQCETELIFSCDY